MAKLKNSIKNIEGIIKEIKKKTKSLKSLTKLDGITIECTIFKNSNIDAIFFNRYPETDVFYPKATHIIEDLSQLKPLFL